MPAARAERAAPAGRAEPARRRVLAQVVLIVVGAAIFVGAVLYGLDPSPSCRGEAMSPGSVCTKADRSAGQTYELLRSQARIGAGVMAVVGLGVAGFGVALLRQARRGAPRRPE